MDAKRKFKPRKKLHHKDSNRTAEQHPPGMVWKTTGADSVASGFSPEPRGRNADKDPLISLLQELRDRKGSEPYIAATLQKIVAHVEHGRERGLDYTNVDPGRHQDFGPPAHGR